MKLAEPLPGNIDGQRVFIVDVSRQGLRVAHQESLGTQGERRRIDFEWDGRRISVEFTIVILRSAQGEVAGSVAVMRDVTKRFEEVRDLKRRLADVTRPTGCC